MYAFTAIFDACVLYPAPLRDHLMYLTELRRLRRIRRKKQTFFLAVPNFTRSTPLFKEKKVYLERRIGRKRRNS